jgi:hypothetical protein
MHHSVSVTPSQQQGCDYLSAATTDGLAELSFILNTASTLGCVPDGVGSNVYDAAGGSCVVTDGSGSNYPIGVTIIYGSTHLQLDVTQQGPLPPGVMLNNLVTAGQAVAGVLTGQ